MWNPVRAKKHSVLKGYARTADKYRQSAKAQSAQARMLPAKPVSTFAERGVRFLYHNVTPESAGLKL
jgi:hypothetical protein